MSVGISAVGVAIPRGRISAQRIHDAWRNQPWSVVARGGVLERAVNDPDGDVITLAAEAAQAALDSWDGAAIDAVFLGTQTSPYLTRASSAVIADILGLPRRCFATDLQFAGKSGTAAVISAYAWVAAGLGTAALAIGADTLGPHVAPGDPAEYTAGAGAAAVIVTSAPTLATIDGIASVTSDTADGYRLDGERYIRSGGASMTVTGIGFKAHASDAWAALRAKLEVRVEDVAHVVLQQPDVAIASGVARALGFSREQAEAGMIAAGIGDVGSASTLIGLAKVLEGAASGARIGVVSYGVGAGSDAFLLTATGEHASCRVAEVIAARHELDYATTIRHERRFHGNERLAGAFD